MVGEWLGKNVKLEKRVFLKFYKKYKHTPAVRSNILSKLNFASCV